MDMVNNPGRGSRNYGLNGQTVRFLGSEVESTGHSIRSSRGYGTFGCWTRNIFFCGLILRAKRHPRERNGGMTSVWRCVVGKVNRSGDSVRARETERERARRGWDERKGEKFLGQISSRSMHRGMLLSFINLNELINVESESRMEFPHETRKSRAKVIVVQGEGFFPATPENFPAHFSGKEK